MNNKKGKDSITVDQFKEGFQNFQRVFHNAVDPVLLISGERLLNCNDAAVAMLEAENRVDVLSMHPSEISPVDQPDGENSFDKANRMIHLALKNGFHRFEWVHKKMTGELFSVEVSLTVIELGGQEVLHALWKDLTVQKNIEESLRTALHKAESANQVKNRFLSQMSHELRTPLNAILGFAQLLEMESDDHFNDDQKEYVQEILRGGRCLLDMVNELLDLSGLETDTAELQLGDVPVQKLISDSLKTIEQRQNLSDTLSLIVEPIAEDIDFIYADFNRTRQILVNLISNAIKCTGGKGEIVISCRKMPDGMLRISIKNAGVSALFSRQKDLFQPSYKVKSNDASADVAGAGLAISRSLVKLMSGRIGHVISEKSGSTFWVELPLIVTSNQHKKFSGEGGSKAADLAVEGKVLYIEDNLVNAALMKNFFSGSDQITYLWAEDAEDGIEIARRELPDLILLDIHLPGINGWEALKILKSMPETTDVPVVAISAGSEDEDIAKGKAAGFTYYLGKPVDFDKLTEIINSVFEQVFKV